MKITLVMICALIARLCCANMASPIWEGTNPGSVFSSREVDVIHEKIFVTIDRAFSTASFVIEYVIKTDADEKQIPLLFHANDYRSNFRVWVDNREVNLLDIPEQYETLSSSPFEKFSNYFDEPRQHDERETMLIHREANSGAIYRLNDLKYFETDLAKGEHTIRVEYTAYARTDVSGWVRAYSLRYSLSPAKHWKSFGSLEITLDAVAPKALLTTNLGQPASGQTDSIAYWKFTGLLADDFYISYTPRISGFANAMIAIGPTGIMCFFTLLFVLLHLFSIKTYRDKNPEKRFSWVVIAGSVVIPFLILVSHMISYELIDSAIGNEAGGYHGYTFIVVFLYPLFMPVYWLIMWLADKAIKKRKNNATDFQISRAN